MEAGPLRKGQGMRIGLICVLALLFGGISVYSLREVRYHVGGRVHGEPSITELSLTHSIQRGPDGKLRYPGAPESAKTKEPAAPVKPPKVAPNPHEAAPNPVVKPDPAKPEVDKPMPQAPKPQPMKPGPVKVQPPKPVKTTPPKKAPPPEPEPVPAGPQACPT